MPDMIPTLNQSTRIDEISGWMPLNSDICFHHPFNFLSQVQNFSAFTLLR
ncbi:hypothetical protein [Candidatus Pantoea floridensis]|nr:hypothetical protein [Pantoea floridensis]